MIARSTKKFIKSYSKSSLKIRNSFDERLKIFSNNKFDPILNNHPLSGKYENHRSININGDWRAIYIDMQEKGIDICLFAEMGTHSQLYK